MNDRKLFLLDGMALMYRAYFAFSNNPRVTSTGLDTSAVFGFATALLDLLQREKPTHLAVVFDTDKPTKRHEVYEAYKGHREEMPESLRKSIPYIIRLIEAWRIPLLMMDGYEADDIIGTLAWQYADKGYTVYMMTPDKDFGQLVRDKVFIYKPARMGNGIEILGVPEILSKWEIERPDQVIDILGLWGDASDNIPGIPGIGEKTAKSLIARYGSMEGIIANVHELKGKQRENVEAFAAQGLLSKQLATIDTAVPIEVDEAQLVLEKPDPELMKPLLQELEFKTISRKILGESAPVQTDLFGQSLPSAQPQEELPAPSNLRTWKDTNAIYHLVQSRVDLQQLTEQLSAQTAFCFDTETSSLDPHTCSLVGLSFCFEAGKAWYVSIPGNELTLSEVLQALRPVLESEEVLKIGQNIKFDLQVLACQGITVGGPLFDTMIAHYLLEPDLRHGMDFLAETYLQYTPISITELIGKKGKDQGTMADVAPELVARYAGEDADITWQLYQYFAPLLPQNGVDALFKQVEMPLVRVLAEVELNGVAIDTQALAEFSKTLEQQAAALEQEIYQLAGTNFNIGSPKQLGDVLFEWMKLDPKAKKTKTGQYKTDEEVLSYLAASHPIAQKVLDYRGIQKLKSTYVDALPGMINPQTGRVHTNYHQAVAATGRLSSQNPNLQNIPVKTDQGKEVRKAFVPGNAGAVLLSADYSQIELRLIAEISGDPAMREAFRHGMDIHTATAAKVYHVDPSEVDATLRRNAKTVNFGIIYGISGFGLSQRLGIPRGEASELIKNYFATYPRIKEYMDETIQKAKEQGYVETLMGRRRYIRDINSANATVRGYAERNAINAPIQGSAADLIKVAMINIWKRMKAENLQSKMIMQVHDELVFEVPDNEVETMKSLVTWEMAHAMPTTVPLEAEAGIGDNWLEAH